LDVSDPSNPHLSIVHGLESEDQEVDYLTLSHCWGDGKIFKLQEDNLVSLQKKVPTSQLSQTFKDAIAITNELGYRYLWIDALCIIQDSKEDWAREGSLMAQVYGNAIMNLAACNPSRDAGLFQHRNPLGYLPCKIASDECSMFVVPETSHFPDHLPLFSRGWIVQERYLSKRNVFFGAGELHWECFVEVAVESWPQGTGTPDDKGISGRALYRSQKKATFGTLLHDVSLVHNSNQYNRRTQVAEFFSKWKKLVEAYQLSNLTFSSDKIASLAGIGSVIARLSSFDYVAGMWMTTLPAALLWYRKPEVRPTHLQITAAPSWSWVKMAGPIRHSWRSDYDTQEDMLPGSSLIFDSKEFRRHPYPAYLLDYRIKRPDGAVTILGEVAEARLRLQGVIRHIHELFPNTDTNFRCDCSRKRCKQSHSVFSGLTLPVEFYGDMEGSEKLKSLHFFVLSRGILRNMYFEEGLVLAPFHDGFIRVGFMRVGHAEVHRQVLTENLSWGGGQNAQIFLY
jgi:hypothetical protein